MLNVLNETGSQLLVLLIIIPVAIVVFFFGSRAWRRERGADNLRPRGRSRRSELGTTGRRSQGEAFVRLRHAPPTPISKAARGFVRFEATIVQANPPLGGDAQRPYVWRNRAGAPADAAVAADLVIIADESGRCGIEHLDRADVRAKAVAQDRHRQVYSLRVGDRVEVCGWFEPEGEHQADHADLVYGTVGSTRELAVSQLPDAPSPTASPEDA